MIKQNERTVPYYNVLNADWEYTLMRELRKELLPKYPSFVIRVRMN